MTGSDFSNVTGAADDNPPAAHGGAYAELMQTPELRVGVVDAPAKSAFFVALDHDTGAPHGVTVDLAHALAHRLGVPCAIHVFPNSGACTEALETGRLDVTFLPVDEERRRRVAFGPAYYNMESTFLVTAASGIESLADVDREDVRVVGIVNTTTIRSATRSLKNTTPIASETILDAVNRLRDGQADALALSRDAFQTLLPQLPNARVLAGGFQSTGIAVAVGHNRPAALAYVSRFIEDAKASGLIRRSLDAAGFVDEPVAPVSL